MSENKCNECRRLEQINAALLEALKSVLADCQDVENDAHLTSEVGRKVVVAIKKNEAAK